MPPVTISLLLLVSCAVAGLVLTGLARWMSRRTGIMDLPGERKIHQRPVAYLGGLGFTLTVIAGVVLFCWLRPIAALTEWRLIVVFLMGLSVVFLVGLWDDVVGVRPMVKLGMQLLVAGFLWSEGVRVERLTIGLDESVTLVGAGEGLMAFVMGSLPSLLITLGWYAALMNAINLIDGLDGLASGVSGIASMCLAAVALSVIGGGATLGMVLPAIVAGACIGFLFHNWHPARIFLGDSGSLTIGYTLATASLLTSTKAPALLALLIPMVALGVPLFETAFSFLRRAIKGDNPFRADRRHLHHRLLDAGLDQKRVVLVFWYATAYFGLNAVLMAREGSILLLVNVGLLGIGLLMLVEYLRFFERRRAANESIQS